MSPTGTARYRRYRLLARTYPPGPRRAELLDTMLMVAEDTGRRRPSAREVANVLRHAPAPGWGGRATASWYPSPSQSRS